MFRYSTKIFNITQKAIVKQKKLIFEQDSENKNDEFYGAIINALMLYNIFSEKIQEKLLVIKDYADKGLVDFELVLRGLKKVMDLKGGKQTNCDKYFKQIINSLKKREDVKLPEPEEELTTIPPEESIIPGKVYGTELYYLQIELLKLQDWLNKTGKTLLVVFEGRDTAGKGSTIRKWTENLNPKYYNVIVMGIPTPEDRKNWWDRYRKQIQKGKINLFDRSWYNRGIVEPVMGYGTPEEYNDFVNNIVDFENDLTKDGDFLFKLWFSIEKETQQKRFEKRLGSPLKKWKFSPNDAKMQEKWDEFTEFKDKIFDASSTVNNPWVILDSNDKRVSGLNSIRYVLRNIPYEDKDNSILDVDYPEAVTVYKPTKH